jgi:hypothetical protein
MGDIGAISEHDMVLAFLRAEFDAPRYRDFYLAALRSVGGSRQHLIDDADFDNSSDNSDREKLLGMVRGYKQNIMLFAGFPNDISWQRTEISITELETFQYARFPTLLELASSRWVSDGAKNALIPTTFSEPLQAMINGIRPLLKRVEAGETLEELIAVRDFRSSNIVLLEGHTRATAYVAGQQPQSVRILIGTSARMHEWPLY